MSWTNDIALEFLDHYRIEPLLWDPKHPSHRNRSEVKEAWQRIQNSLSIHYSIVDLKRKKESLMTSFRFHYNRKKKCPGEYQTTWFAYSFMESFLGGKYECDSTINQNDHEEPIASSHATTATADRLSTNRRIDRSKSQTTAAEYLYNKRQLDADSYVKDAKTYRTEMDEYDLYGQLLAKKLRKLDEHQRDVAMHDIDNIMFNAKMQSGPQNRSYSASPSPVPRKSSRQSPVFIITQQNHDQFEDENITYSEQPTS